MVKNLPANAGDTGLNSGSENPLEKEVATHSSILPRLLGRPAAAASVSGLIGLKAPDLV